MLPWAEAVSCSISPRIDENEGVPADVPPTAVKDPSLLAKPFVTVDAPYRAFWPLEQGNHTFQARLESTGTTSQKHDVVVR